MNAVAIIREIMSQRGWSQSKLASEVGYKRQSNVAALLTTNTNIKVCNLVELCEAMGYEVVVRDKMGSKTEFRVTDRRAAE